MKKTLTHPNLKFGFYAPKIMFKVINNISDVQPFVVSKKEIKFSQQSNGITIGSYMFVDSNTFDIPEALECRGIAFDQKGQIISRPLHKFFNIGEKEHLRPELLLERTDIAAIYEKLDGSMIATSRVDGQLQLRSKKSYSSEVVKLANIILHEKQNIRTFAHSIANSGMTAIFELTHPEARIVVAQDVPQLRLLHVRDNVTGQYLLLDKSHAVHELIERLYVPTVEKYDLTISDVLSSLENMRYREGYVIQFTSGDMVKVKCPWYIRLHRSVTFLRERDIARLAMHEELDDIKTALSEAGIDLSEVNAVETRVKNALVAIDTEVDLVYTSDKHLNRKSFAVKHSKHPLFALIMPRYLGMEVPLLDWYERHFIRDYGLHVLASSAVMEEVF